VAGGDRDREAATGGDGAGRGATTAMRRQQGEVTTGGNDGKATTARRRRRCNDGDATMAMRQRRGNDGEATTARQRRRRRGTEDYQRGAVCWRGQMEGGGAGGGEAREEAKGRDRTNSLRKHMVKLRGQINPTRPPARRNKDSRPCFNHRTRLH
jgi:hypothetical protein